MTVYVDSANIRYRRMAMCHMMADRLSELHGMADRIGISCRHFQGDHYDICKAKKSLALIYGAKEVTSRFLVNLRKQQRASEITSRYQQDEVRA